jgi:phosphopantothenoylcysteine decarboxylase/phosphopantothenate--cysteine ligase
VTLSGRHVVLGVSGGIASYKACTLARRLTERGADVDVVMTAGAQEFVRPATFEALTGRPVLTSLWAADRALAHIGLARTPDLVVLAPATAHLLARAALGLADDLLTSLLLARTGPVLAAPAMNDRMYAHPATQENLATLARRGWRFVGPDTGPLAEGPTDQPGRMTEPDVIAAEATRLLRAPGSKLAGRHVLVTAGPTREALDDIRVITNRSSGRMGYALAEAAWLRGASVTLVSGPTTLQPPHGPELLRIETTAELAQVVAEQLPAADCLLMAAAPADFRPANPATGKRPRGDGDMRVALSATPDVLGATRDRRKAGATIVGFAYESAPGLDRARAKLAAKALDMVVVNYAGRPDAGTEARTNQVTLLTAAGEQALPLLPKPVVAEHVLDAVEAAR